MKPPSSPRENDSSKSLWPVIRLCASLLIPSTGQVQKYLGTYGVFAYLFVCSTILIVCIKRIVSVSTLTRQQTTLWTFITFLAIILIFAVVYPIANSGIVGGGSDNDDDLNKTALRLL